MYFVGVGKGDLDTTESSRWCTLEVHTVSLARERERVVNSLRLLNAFGTCCGCLCALVPPAIEIPRATSDDQIENFC
jgi:hypothetical protein